MALAVSDIQARPAARWQYRPELDGLRAVAITAVVLTHYDQPLAPGGYLGVTLFFVISGYLITGMLRAELNASGSVDLPAFYARRILRLYPALLVMVALFLPVGLAVRCQPTNETVTTAIASLFYGNDFLSARSMVSPYFGQTWSLAVEEQFYLIWPLVLAVLLHHRHWSQRSLGPLLATTAAAVGLLYVVLQTRLAWPYMYYLPSSSVMALMAGASLAFLCPRTPRWLAVSAGTGFLVACMAGPVFDTAPVWQGFQQFGVACSVILVAAGIGGSQVLRARPLVWIGRRSYAIYLFHLGLHTTLTTLCPGRTTMFYLLVCIPATILVAELSFRYIEQPCLHAKHRFARLDTASVLPAGQAS